jgi:RHS repeat-associated protein
VLWVYDSRYGDGRVHSDVHGNVIGLLGWSGNGMVKYTYDAFGKAKIKDWAGNEVTSGAWNRFMFQGREWIAELGIYDYRHRMYQPELGRFLQTDPTGFDGGDMNLFRYCADDPVDLTDPTGLAGVGLTSWGKGAWVTGSDGITYEDRWRMGDNRGNAPHDQPAGMDGGLIMAGQYPRENEGKKPERNRPALNQPGKPDYAVRSIKRAYVTKKGDTYFAHVFWRIQLFHNKDQKPLGRGIQVREEVRWSDTIDFKAKEYIRGEQPTRDDGSIDDPWNLPFSSPNGQAKTTQTIFAAGREATWDATVYANGRIDAQQYVEFAEPSR